MQVIVNVYDMTEYNKFIYYFGFGIFHSGVEILNTEYCFGGHPYSSTGVFQTLPKKGPPAPNIKFRRSIVIGKTNKTDAEIRRIIEIKSAEFRGDSYHLLNRNCNHFSNELCMALCGEGIPGWVNRLAYIGSWVPCIFPEHINEPAAPQNNSSTDILMYNRA